MKFKCPFLLILLSVFFLSSNAQVVTTSYVNSAGEKVLRQELVLPVGLQKAWDYCTVDSLLQKWAAPRVHMELRAGGYRSASYNKDLQGVDSNAIVLPLVCFLDKELLVLKINLNGNFPESVQKTDDHLCFIFRFQSIDTTHTRITGSMVGWGKGPDWDKTYDFFERGNRWTFEQLLKVF